MTAQMIYQEVDEIWQSAADVIDAFKRAIEQTMAARQANTVALMVERKYIPSFLAVAHESSVILWRNQSGTKRFFEVRGVDVDDAALLESYDLCLKMGFVKAASSGYYGGYGDVYSVIAVTDVGCELVRKVRGE